ncbi:sulfotransferase family 2 domain-containing protein [Phormidium tenue FACHB-886]|nr:sulfotransferase family 2 domain-containing protein [Phormidium tenue FACHB-886]
MRNFPAQYHLQDQDVMYFSHIPKTAGMTFRTIVEDHFHEDETCPATLKAQIKTIAPEEFQRYRLFRGHLGHNNIPALVPGKRMINVTVMREPIARVISHYEYIRRMPGDPFYEAVKEMTLEEFAYKLPFGKLKKNVQTYYIAKFAQFDFDDLTPPEILELAHRGLNDAAFVGLVERFQDSLFLLSYIFGWRPIINTRRENAAKAKKSLEEIPASTIEAIRENSLLDIELYQSAKEIFEQRFDQMTQDLVEKYLDQVAPGLQVDLSQPLPEDLLAKLLDCHYNQRYVDLHLPASSHVIYDFAQPLRGMGWQRRERAAELGDFRWMGPGTQATLDLPIAKHTHTDLVVEFRLIRTHLVAPDILQSLRLTVNGQPIELYLLHSEQGSRFYQGLIPQAVLASSDRVFTEIQFQVDRVASLQEVNPLDPDARMLGLAFNYVQVFPAAQRYEKSALASSFDSPAWKAAAEFVRDRAKPEEGIAAPLIFRASLLRPISDYAAFLTEDKIQWVVLHKGRTEKLAGMLAKLFTKGFRPVFANEVFVVFSTRRDGGAIAYSSEHVKPLYVDFLKRTLSGTLKSFYRKHKGKANPAQA